MLEIISKSYSTHEKVIFYESIANLLEWWVTLVSALKGFSKRLMPSRFKEIIENTIFFVESGDAMNRAMRKIPVFYGEKEIAIVESWEQTGMLSTSFWAIARELRMQEELKKKIEWALTYPFIIFFFLILALMVVMVYVIPQIMPIISEMATEIPWSTRSLVATSNFLKGNIFSIIVFFTAFGLIFSGFVHTPSGKKWFDGQKITFPILGKVYKNYTVVQLMDTFSLLMLSGVSILTTLKLTGSSSGNSIVALMFSRIAEDVSKWKKITEGFQSADPYGMIFSSDIVQMFESAERTSTVALTSRKIGEQYRKEVDSSLAIMVKYIEPIALLSAWIFVLWFAIAIFSAIMQVVTISWN